MEDPVPQPCDCAPAPGPATPRLIANPPGQSAIVARVGDHAAFLDSLLAGTIKAPQLDGLKVREGDDFTIGLLDAWAVTLDVLTFYQERIANEGYLGTATERRSVLELARTIGYELAPGVAAEAHLAFGLDLAGGQAGAPGLPEAMRLEAGLAAQSIPQPGQSPAIYETVEPVEARGAWNSVGAVLTKAQKLGSGTTELWLSGIEAGIRRGDSILLVGGDRRKTRTSDQWDVRAVETVTLHPDRNLTHVTWHKPLGSKQPAMEAAADDATLEVWHLGASARLFGANAPDVRSLHADIRTAYSSASDSEWAGFDLEKIDGAPLASGAADGKVQIDGGQPLVAGDWLVFVAAGYTELYEVKSARETSARGFTLTAKTTLTDLSGENLHAKFHDKIRETAIWRATRRFTLGRPPAEPVVRGKTVELERIVPGLKAGQTVAVSEALPPPAPPGVPPVHVEPGEILTLTAVAHGPTTTTVTFDRALARDYPVAAFRLHANVARATHGASREEVLGSGSGAAAFQKFTLSDKLLTHVSARAAGGRATTLEIWVNRQKWQEVESFVGQPADARVYVTRCSDDGTVTIVFGDGLQGARLPTGAENIVARYRVGTGARGRVDDRQISLLMTRPLGLSSVFNPAPSTGGADPETRDAARASAPGTVTALGRIVSLTDFEDFALGFAGVAKARAARLWTGKGWLAHLTVASDSGEAMPPGHPLLETLRKAIDGARDITQPFRIDDHRPNKVRMELKLKTAPDRDHDDVKAALTLRLATALGRTAQGLAQPITSSAIYALAHGVPGVVAIDLDGLEVEGELGKTLANGGLIAFPARMAGATPLPADLLLLDQIVITRMDP